MGTEEEKVVVDAPADVPPVEQEEVVVTFGDEPAPESEEDKSPAPEWVRDLRVKQRELAKENRALKDQLAARQPAEAKHEDLGKEPELEDFDYDTGKFKEAYRLWMDKKAAHDAKLNERKAEEDKAKADWDAKLSGYEKAKTELKADDFDDAESLVTSSLNQTQQGLILRVVENPALFVLALGRNPDKIKALAAIKDPVDFTVAIADLRKEMKSTTRKGPPPPEKKPQGSAPISGAVDAALDRLEAEAAKTGDRSKVIAYKRAQRNK